MLRLLVLAMLCVYGHCRSRRLAHVMTEDMQTDIVKIHNDIRMVVGATNMATMYWDEKLAKVAEKNIKKCPLIPYIGQMYGKELGQIVVAMPYDIHDQVEYLVDTFTMDAPAYESETGRCKEEGLCDGYKQVLWADAFKVGCAQRYCSNYRGNKYLVICNYNRPMVPGRFPYRFDGLPCSACYLLSETWFHEEFYCSKRGTKLCDNKEMEGANEEYDDYYGYEYDEDYDYYV